MEINVNGYRIFYKITGKGEDTVVLLQGWGTSCSLYDSVAAVLSPRYRVVQFDMPGFGDSDEPREAWSVDDYADFFLDFMQALGIGSAALWGHSYGGRVMIKLMARENLPFRIERAVLVDSAGVLPKKTFRKKMKIAKYKMIRKIVNVKLIYKMFPDLIEEWRKKQGSEDYKNATPMMRQCMVKAVNEDLTPLFEKNKLDTLLVWGELDTATPVADGKLMEERMEHAGLAVMKGTGHFCFLENPVQFAGIMRSYFEIKE